MSTLFVEILGEPAPQGSKNAYVINGRPVLVESSKKVKPWRATVAASAHQAAHEAGWSKSDLPLRVHVDFFLKRPVSVTRQRPDRKPDIDKLLRSVLDGISDAGTVWSDDARVVELSSVKHYSIDFIGAAVTITEIHD